MAGDDDEDGDSGIDPGMLARAEQAIAALGDTFRAAAAEDIATMRAAVEAVAAGGDAAGLVTVAERAHDMAGQGESFGYPLLSRLGRSLCDFLAGRRGACGPAEIALLHAHIDAAEDVLDGAGDEAHVAALEARHRA